MLERPKTQIILVSKSSGAGEILEQVSGMVSEPISVVWLCGVVDNDQVEEQFSGGMDKR